MKEVDGLKETNKKILDDLNTAIIEKNTKQKELNEMEVKLSGAENKVKSLTRKLEKASSRESTLQVGHKQFLEAWKRSPEGLTFLGKMATNSYRMAIKETKERLKGILAGSDLSINWNDLEAEFDLRVRAEEGGWEIGCC